MKKTKAWALVYKRTGNIAVHEARLPLFWIKSVAEEELKRYPKCELKEVVVSESTH